MSSLSVDVCAAQSQSGDHLKVPAACRRVQRSRSIGTLRVDVRAQLHQRGDHLHVPAFCSPVEWTPSFGGLCVHISAELNQGREHRHLSRLCCPVQRSASSATRNELLHVRRQRSVHVRPRSRQPPHLRHVALARRPHQILHHRLSATVANRTPRKPCHVSKANHACTAACSESALHAMMSSSDARATHARTRPYAHNLGTGK